MLRLPFTLFFFFNDTATTEIYTLSLHDALPISYDWQFIYNVHLFFSKMGSAWIFHGMASKMTFELGLHRKIKNQQMKMRSEEHTSELQSPCNLVCRLLLEKKKQATSNMPVSA